MIDSRYAKAYTEVLEIIKYFPNQEYTKIPIEKIDFYKKYMDKTYKFTIRPEIDLSNQKISPEANAIIVNLFLSYFATEDQKSKTKTILDLNQKMEEQKKEEIYNIDNIFKNSNRNEKLNNETRKNNNAALIKYKEPFFKKFKNFIYRIMQRYFK